jgi:hypothetical protein
VPCIIGLNIPDGDTASWLKNTANASGVVAGILAGLLETQLANNLDIDAAQI